jgi:hypothetical protein
MLKQILREVKNSLPNNKVYIFGQSLRDIILKKEVEIYEFHVDCRVYDRDEVKSESYKYLSNVPNFPINKVRFTLSKSKIDFSNTYYAMDCIWCDIESILNGSIEIEYKYKALDDINKNLIRLNPKIDLRILGIDFIFDVIKTASLSNFSLDIGVVTKIFNMKELLLNCNPIRIKSFIDDCYCNGGKPRKITALLNTLGISNCLFGGNLFETSSVNHLKKEDILEIYAMVFSTIKDVVSILNKYYFTKDEIEYIILVMSLLNTIEEQNSEEAKKFVKSLNEDKIKVMERILTIFGLSPLRKKIKEEKHNVNLIEKLAITENDLRVCFRDVDVDKMLSFALEKVKERPELNTKSSLLLLLNKERR